MDNLTIILLLSGVALVILYLYISKNEDDDISNGGKKMNNAIKCPNRINENFTQETIDNEESEYNGENFGEKNGEQISENNDDSQMISQIHAQEDESVNNIQEEQLINKLKTQNQAKDGEYKQMNYTQGNRDGAISNDWENNFISSNDLLGSMDQFSPTDETNNMFATFSPTVAQEETVNLNGNFRGKNAKDEKPEDIYDVEKLLPKEIKKNWFEVTPEPIKAKDRHLINTIRPTGLNTIGSTLRNASWDLRNTPACQKKVESPWLQSSIEPDTNIKPMCGL